VERSPDGRFLYLKGEKKAALSSAALKVISGETPRKIARTIGPAIDPYGQWLCTGNAGVLPAKPALPFAHFPDSPKALASGMPKN
jgi:hypothetical protein